MKRGAYIFPALSAAVISEEGKFFLFEQHQDNDYKIQPLTGYKWSQLVYLNPEYKEIEFLNVEELSLDISKEKEKQDALEIAIRAFL